MLDENIHQMMNPVLINKPDKKQQILHVKKKEKVFDDDNEKHTFIGPEKIGRPSIASQEKQQLRSLSVNYDCCVRLACQDKPNVFVLPCPNFFPVYKNFLWENCSFRVHS